MPVSQQPHYGYTHTGQPTCQWCCDATLAFTPCIRERARQALDEMRTGVFTDAEAEMAALFDLPLGELPGALRVIVERHP